MEPESLVQLAAGGNASTVEREWMAVVEKADGDPAKLVRYDVVLAALRKRGKATAAAELAWAAIETVASTKSPRETLEIAGPFLLAVGNGEELRNQVTELYRAAYEGADGLEELIREAGLPSGRPVRRALRTLDVCLSLSEGDYLRLRDEEGAARVKKIKPVSCEITIDTGDATETVGSVELADTYLRTEPDDFWVMRQFQREALTKRLWNDPASVVVELCRQANDNIDSNELERLLAPDLIENGEWKKWWTKARTALKKCPNVELEGRTPYYIRYRDDPVSAEEQVISDFQRLRDPAAQLKLVEGYIRECKVRGREPQGELLTQIHDIFVKRTALVARKSLEKAGLTAAAACRIGAYAGVEDADTPLRELLAGANNTAPVFKLLESGDLATLACDALVAAKPDDWQVPLRQLLPELPAATCDRAAVRLVDAGATKEDFEEIVQRIFVSPADHFEALLWLWDGPTSEQVRACIIPINILTRTLRMLEDVRVAGKASREIEKQIRARVRAVLSARHYERLIACLGSLDMGVMRALRWQVSRAEGLAVSVRGDMLKEIDKRLPLQADGPSVAPWAEEDVLYVTEAGLSRKHAEIERHVNVTMKKNAEDIGRAAEHGDLSENSEYKFALEERDLLRARLGLMNGDVAKSKVLRPEDVPTDHIGVGSRVVFQRVEDDEVYEMFFCGPWEADIEAGWFNYQAPLAQKLMGKTVGEIVEFDHTGAKGRYEIVSLGSVLEDVEAPRSAAHASGNG